MTERKSFQSIVTYDLPTYKELMKGMWNAMPLTKILQIVIIIYLMSHVLAIPFSGDTVVYIYEALALVGVYIVAKLINRNGGIQYKQMLSTNNDRIPRYCLTISEALIHAENLDNGNKDTYGFEKIRVVGETENLVFVLLEHRLGIAIDKRTVTGGSVDELIQYLLQSCPNLKKRKVHSANGERIRKTIIAALLVIGIVLTLI